MPGNLGSVGKLRADFEQEDPAQTMRIFFKYTPSRKKQEILAIVRLRDMCQKSLRVTLAH